MVAVEVRVGELPELGLLGRVVLERALLEVGHLVEAVHVELADKGGEAVVLEEAREHLVAEADVVGDEEGGAVGRPADELVGVGVVDHAAELVEEGGVVLVGGYRAWRFGGAGDADVADVAADAAGAAGAGVTSVGLTTGDGAVEGVGLDWKGCGEVVGGRKGCGGEL
ncbi:hypothetical protein L1887_55321 [Cichorium endivia]|nr:hypothetical protein L1887_55321 [Cichorium endivia]